MQLVAACFAMKVMIAVPPPDPYGPGGSTDLFCVLASGSAPDDIQFLRVVVDKRVNASIRIPVHDEDGTPGGPHNSFRRQARWTIPRHPPLGAFLERPRALPVAAPGRITLTGPTDVAVPVAIPAAAAISAYTIPASIEPATATVIRIGGPAPSNQRAKAHCRCENTRRYERRYFDTRHLLSLHSASEFPTDPSISTSLLYLHKPDESTNCSLKYNTTTE